METSFQQHTSILKKTLGISGGMVGLLNSVQNFLLFGQWPTTNIIKN